MVLGEGPDKAWFKDLFDVEKKQDLCGFSMGSVWAQPEKETWVHHPQEEPQRSVAMWIRWQSKAGALAVQSPVADAIGNGMILL